MAGWTEQDIPDQDGRTAVVTGATSGLGLQTARALAEHGARVVMACRDPARGSAALDRVQAAAPAVDVQVRLVDLADLASVRAFAAAAADLGAIDLLVNNAGVMATPRRTTTDGFELQLGTNHLGHFALTGLLLPLLLARPHARVVTVSSLAHRSGRIDFDDLLGQRRYRAWTAYGQSKLANLLFMRELDRQAGEHGTTLISVAAHPGDASTNLVRAGIGSRLPGWLAGVPGLVNGLFAQSARMGALPQLYAATAPGMRGGEYVGPDRFFEQRGHPTLAGLSPRARDDAAARRLWSVSTELTGVSYAWPPG